MGIENAVDQAAVADSLVGDSSNIVAVSDVGRTPDQVAVSDRELEESGESQQDVAEQYEPVQDEQQDEGQMSPEELEAMLAEQQEQQLEQQEQQPPEQFQPQEQAQTFEQWHQNAYQLAQQINDPVVAQQFAFDFLSAFGVDQQSAIAWATSPQGRGLADVMMTYAMNAIRTVMPLYFQAPSDKEGQNWLQSIMETHGYEGIGDVAQSQVASRAWQTVSADTPMGKLKYGTAEFSQAMQKANEIIPDLEHMQFPGKDGKPLPLNSKENMRKQFEVAINALSGGGSKRVLDLVQQAVQTGRRLERENRTRRSAGNLGAGQSKGFSANHRDDMDEFFGSIEQMQDALGTRKL